MNILIIDDHRLFADGLKLVISDMDEKKEFVIDQAYSAQRALDLVNSGSQYDLILTDLDMPGISGHELLQSLLSRKVAGCIAVISASNTESDIRRAYQLGARGYIYKSESAFEMQSKLKALLDGQLSFPEDLGDTFKKTPSIQESSNNDATPQSLGRRPKQVLELIAQGKSNKQIAIVLNITETTVKFHIRTLFNSLGVNNRTWCVREASRRSLIEAKID